MNKTLPQVSIIIPAYNEELSIKNCLNSLSKLDYPEELIEIIVVDNNSTDNTKKIITDCGAIYVFEQKRNRSSAKNRGIETAKGSVICFLDAHSTVASDWLKNLLKGLEGGKIGACGGKIIAVRPETIFEKYLNYRANCIFENLHSEDNLFMLGLTSANVAIPRNVLEKTGLFDEKMNFCEDIDMSWRICFSGFGLKYVPEAVVCHKYIDKPAGFYNRIFNYAYYSAKLTQKYKKSIDTANPADSWKDTLAEYRRIFMTSFKGMIKAKTYEERMFSIFNTLYFFLLIAGICWLTLKRAALGNKGGFSGANGDNNVSGSIELGTDAETFVTDFSSNYHFHINQTGSDILKMHRAGKTCEEITAYISAEYEIDDKTAREDVQSFIESLELERSLN